MWFMVGSKVLEASGARLIGSSSRSTNRLLLVGVVLVVVELAQMTFDEPSVVVIERVPKLLLRGLCDSLRARSRQ